MNNRGNKSNGEFVVGVPGHVVEEFLVVGVLLGFSDLGVFTEGVLQLGNRDVDVLGQFLDALNNNNKEKGKERKGSTR